MGTFQSFSSCRRLIYRAIWKLIDERRKVGGDVMRPGLTGWAQINGRDSITQDEKVRLDEFYSRGCSLMMDLRIVLGTLGAVSRSEDGTEESGEPVPAEVDPDPVQDIETGGTK